MNGVLSFANLADIADLSASSASGDLSPSNLADPIIQRPWRGVSGSEWCQADLGSSKPIGLVAIVIPRSGLMLGSADTIRLQLDDVTPGSGAVYDSGPAASGIIPSIGTWLAFFASPLSARYVRLTFATGNAYVQVGRLWVAAYLQTQRNFSFSWGREWSDGATITKAPKSGIRFRNSGPRFRTLSIAWNYLSPDDATAMEDGDILTGLSAQMLVCTNPDNPARTTIIGTPKETSPIAQPSAQLFQKALTLEEDL